MLLLDQSLGVVTEINCKSGLDRTGFTRSLHTVLQMKVKDDGLDKTFKFICDFEKNVKLRDKGQLTNVAEQHAINKFQKNLLHELTEVAIPITERSSGLKGLKWHWGLKSLNPFKANPHPVNWLPLEAADGTKYFTLDKNGKRHVTDALAKLLCGLSSKRGG